jgi:hypothetical protein
MSANGEVMGMADVIIKDMEKMPRACCECPCVNGNFCGIKNERPTFEEWYESKPDWCPLRPVPEMWISVEERLPEAAGNYIVAYHPCYWDDVKYQVTNVGIDAFRGKTTWAKNKHQRVTHWMPLPEPPDGGDGDR